MVPKLLNKDAFYTDEYSKKIFKATKDFKTVSEISAECNIPITTVYRRVKSLHEFGFLEIRGDIINSIKFMKYRRAKANLYGKNNPRVNMILQLISEKPGLRYSEIKKTTGFPNGTLSHCLSKMIHDGKITCQRFGKRTWFFPPQTDSLEFGTIIQLRKETTKKILFFLLEKRVATFKEIRDHIKKSPSTTSLALTSLIEENIIRRIPGINVKYDLADEKKTFSIIKKIEPSFADSLKERFADTFSYL